MVQCTLMTLHYMTEDQVGFHGEILVDRTGQDRIYDPRHLIQDRTGHYHGHQAYRGIISGEVQVKCVAETKVVLRPAKEVFWISTLSLLRQAYRGGDGQDGACGKWRAKPFFWRCHQRQHRASHRVPGGDDIDLASLGFYSLLRNILDQDVDGDGRPGPGPS